MEVHLPSKRQRQASKLITKLYRELKTWENVSLALGVSRAMVFQIATGNRRAGPKVLAAVDLYRRDKRLINTEEHSRDSEFLRQIREKAFPFLKERDRIDPEKRYTGNVKISEESIERESLKGDQTK